MEPQLISKTTRSHDLGKKTVFSDAAVLSLAEYERIRQNATILSKETQNNAQKIVSNQKELKQANAKVFF